MNTPDYPSLKELCNRIDGASFSIKMRGYSPEEVDGFMDEIVRELEGLQGKLAEIQQYESWLRVELQQQVVQRAQAEARKILQDGQSQANAVLASAQSEAQRQQTELNRTMQQYTADWNAKKEALEKEIVELRGYVKSYRAQAARALKEALNTLERDQRQDNTEAAHYALPSVSARPQATAPQPPKPAYAQQPRASVQLNSVDDIARMMEEIKHQVR